MCIQIQIVQFEELKRISQTESQTAIDGTLRDFPVSDDGSILMTLLVENGGFRGQFRQSPEQFNAF